MSDEAKIAGGYTTMELPENKMFLYEKPQILTREDHGSLGITPAEKPYEFASKAGTIPLVASEITSAQKHYPVIFANAEEPQIFAVVSVIKDRNMFVDERGHWAPYSYVPAYLRRYPYALARGDNDQFALVIDSAAAAVTKEAQFPFFNGDELSEDTNKMVNFCQQMEAERQRTKDFVTRLKELDLLAVQEVKAGNPESDSADKAALASYYAVNTEKLNDLSGETIKELHQAGYLSFIFAHLFSLENWGKLLERRQRMMAASGEQ